MLWVSPLCLLSSSNEEACFYCVVGLAALVQLYTEAINTPGCIPNVQEAWDTFVNTKCFEAKQAALLEYDTLLTYQMSEILPCDNDKIRVVHNAALDKCEEQFMAEIAVFSTDTVETQAKELKVCLATRHVTSLNGMLSRDTYQ